MRMHSKVPAWAWILLLALSVRLVLMALTPMADNSEPRYAEMARLMAASGDWITPWFEPGKPFWGKPPLAFWMSALSLQVFGYSDLAVRLPSLLASIATLALLFNWSRHQFGLQTARMAALIYASSLLPFLMAGAVMLDPWLALAITLSLTTYTRLREDGRLIWHLGFFGGLSLGLLAKGPLAIVLVSLILLAWRIWCRSPDSAEKPIRWIPGLLLVLALTLPWYICAEIKTPGFLRYFLLGEHFARFVDPGWQGDLYGSAHRRPYGSIWLDAMLAAFPWSLVAIWLLGTNLRTHALRRALKTRLADPAIRLLLLWSLSTPVFFSLAGNILWTYVQPSLPGFAILLAIALSRPGSRTAGLPGTMGLHTGYLRLAMLVPAVTLAAGLVIATDPDLLKTERSLVAYHAAHSLPSQPLYYLDARPFSARYYAREQVLAASSDELADLRNRYPAGYYLATPRQQADAIRLQTGAPPPVFSNRRFDLLQVPPLVPPGSPTP